MRRSDCHAQGQGIGRREGEPVYARMKGCSRKAEATIRRNRVIMALCILADDQGLVCEATNAEIARHVGLSVESTKPSLHDLEHDGSISAIDGKGRRRTIVLMDHPEAEAHVETLMGQGRSPLWATGVRLGVYSESECGPSEYGEGVETF